MSGCCRLIAAQASDDGACNEGEKLGMKNDTSSQTTWFVGASYGGTDDQTPRFLKEGIWENGYDD